MPIKKSQIYSSLWSACDELRGGMDASQYKDYILTLLFIKYISDLHKAGRRSLIVVPRGASFDDMYAIRHENDLGDKMNKMVEKITSANAGIGNINVADFDDGNKLGDAREKKEKLARLLAIFSRPELDLTTNRVDGDDILGDAYEYLMKNFATESGKSKGQFYTPAEVSRLKHLRLAVCPPAGEVVITAPLAMDEEAVRLAAVQRLSWIHDRRREFEDQERQSRRTYESGETHYFLGRRYRLKVVYIRPGSPYSMERKGKSLMMNVYADTPAGNREELLHAWYRRQLREMVTPLLAKWCKRLELTVPVFTIRKMKTKWGSCAPDAHRIQLNMDLIKKPSLCIEYVVLHELIHFFEENHTPRFKALLAAHMPTWEHLKDVLNQAPLDEEVWEGMTK